MTMTMMILIKIRLQVTMKINQLVSLDEDYEISCSVHLKNFENKRLEIRNENDKHNFDFS